MKWIKEFVSSVRLNIRYMRNTLAMLMVRTQGFLPNVENVSKNTKESTGSQRKKK